MSFRILRSRLHRRARLGFCLRQLSLLREDARDIQASRDKVRLDPKYGSELSQRAIQLSLPPQHPPQGGMELSITRCAPYRLFEIGPRCDQVTFAQGFLTALIGRRGCGLTWSLCLAPRSNHGDQHYSKEATGPTINELDQGISAKSTDYITKAKEGITEIPSQGLLQRQGLESNPSPERQSAHLRTVGFSSDGASAG